MRKYKNNNFINNSSNNKNLVNNKSANSIKMYIIFLKTFYKETNK